MFCKMRKALFAQLNNRESVKLDSEALVKHQTQTTTVTNAIKKRETDVLTKIRQDIQVEIRNRFDQAKHKFRDVFGVDVLRV